MADFVILHAVRQHHPLEGQYRAPAQMRNLSAGSDCFRVKIAQKCANPAASGDIRQSLTDQEATHGK
jgi:hypothetical protein